MSFILKYYRFRKYIPKIFGFFIVAAIITLLFPREGKFKYEFQKGKPWQYDTYFAPFDFPIYKSDEQIKKEKDSLLNNFTPYFEINQKISDSAIVLFSYEFNQKKSEIINDKKIDKDLSFVFDSCYNILLQIIKNTYNNGIIDINSDDYRTLTSNNRITVVNNNVATEKLKDDILTPLNAYENINSEIQNKLKNNFFKRYSFISNLIDSLNIEKFIFPNLSYNENKTVLSKNELLNSLSFTEGLVQFNERIINKGDKVDDRNWLILQSLKKVYSERIGNTSYFVVLTGQFLIIAFIFLVLFLFLYNFRREVLEDRSKTYFILFLILFITSIASVSLRFSLLNIYIIPFSLVPIMVWTFYDSRLALFIHFIVLMLVGFITPNSYEYILMSFITGIISIFGMKNIFLRGKLFLTACLVVLSYWLLYFSFTIIHDGNLKSFDWLNFAYFGINGIFLLASYPLIYIFERIFGFLSDQTLFEISDTNQKLLRKLAEEAPGTFQHSIQVANIAEDAIISIGGNPHLVRAGALYHDIGKLSSSQYFIENIIGNENPHNKISFEESAQIIIDHVNEGLKIAKKYKIPQPVADFIPTHHGTLKVIYFYRMYRNMFPDKEIDEDKFTYPGPKPYSKETAVVMMADSLEAASRSLKNITADIIDKLVEDIINMQITEKQFDNCNLTFDNITTLKKIFKRKLLNIYHVRMEYPQPV